MINMVQGRFKARLRLLKIIRFIFGLENEKEVQIYEITKLEN